MGAAVFSRAVIPKLSVCTKHFSGVKETKIRQFQNSRYSYLNSASSKRIIMAIHGYTKDEFGEKLATVVNAATPIRSIQHLKGRQQQLQEIERALYAPGRHIFIYGDRGVGKSSLAATAAISIPKPRRGTDFCIWFIRRDLSVPHCEYCSSSLGQIKG